MWEEEMNVNAEVGEEIMENAYNKFVDAIIDTGMKTIGLIRPGKRVKAKKLKRATIRRNRAEKVWRRSCKNNARSWRQAWKKYRKETSRTNIMKIEEKKKASMKYSRRGEKQQINVETDWEQVKERN
jgi:hypothetical protein